MNMSTIGRNLISTFAMLSVAACSGGSSGVPSADDSGTRSPQVRTGHVLLSFREQVAGATTSARKREYLSFAAMQVTISVDGGSPTVINLQNCSLNANGTQAVCPAVGFTAPTGQHTFVVTALDAQSGTQNEIGSGTIVATVAATGTTPLNLTLDGIPASVYLRLSNARPAVGTASTVTLTADAFDIDGYGIIGTFADPITVGESGNTGSTVTLSKTTLTGSADSIAVSYNGAALAQPVVFTPSSTTPISAVSVSLLSGTSQPELVALNFANGSPYVHLDVYDASKTGVQSTIYSLNTNDNVGFGGLAFSPTGDIFYATKTIGLQEFQNYQSSTGGPFAILNAANNPTVIATDKTGLVYALSETDVSAFEGSSTESEVSVAVYKTPFYNSQYPVETLQIPAQYQNYPYAAGTIQNNFIVAIDPTNAVWVPGSDGIDRFATVNGPTTETKTIAYGTALKGVTDMAFGPSGELWICDNGGNQVVKIAAGATTAAGAQTITGSYVTGCTNIRVDSSGNVYVKLGNGANIPVNVFPSTASGAATPIRAITLSQGSGTFALYDI